MWWALASAGLIAVAVVVALVVSGAGEEASESTTVAAQSTSTTGIAPPSTEADSAEADDTTGDSDGSSEDDGGDPSAVAPLTGLSAVITPDRVLSVSWDDPGSEAGYTLTVTPGEPSTLPADVTAFEREPVPCGTPIVVDLVAHTDDGSILASGSATAAAVDCGPQLAPPAELQIVDIPDGDAPMDLVEIHWSDATGEIGYVVTIDRTDSGGEASNRQTVELEADAIRTTTPVSCQGSLEVGLEAVAPDGSRFGRITASFRGPRCNTWDLFGRVEEHLASVDFAAGGLRNVTATCPGDLHLIGGGFSVAGIGGQAVTEDGHPIIVGNRPVGNGWQVTAAAPAGIGLRVAAIALCIPGGEATVVDSPSVGPAGGSTARASCPAGTVLTAGGWWADFPMEVTQSMPNHDVREWVVSAKGDPALETGGVSAYALCLPDDRFEATMVYDSMEVPAGQYRAVGSGLCPEGIEATGGGFAVESIPLHSRPYTEAWAGEDRMRGWLIGSSNVADARALVTSAAICLTVP